MSSIFVHALFLMLTIAVAVVLPPYFGHSVTTPYHVYTSYTSAAVHNPHPLFSGHEDGIRDAPTVHTDTLYEPMTPGYLGHDERRTLYDARGVHSTGAHEVFGRERFPAGVMKPMRPFSTAMQTGAVRAHDRILSTARTSYADYLIKPLHCTKVSTHCCGTKTYIVATCGGTKNLLINFISASDYNYTLTNTRFTDLSGRYFLGSVKICNLGKEGDAFVSVW